MRDAMGKEPVLVPHDFAGHLQNGAGPLLEAAHDPGRIGPGFVREGPDAGLRIAGDAGVETAVGNDARQGIMAQAVKQPCFAFKG